MKYHLFIDESGDPSLSSVDAGFPVFILMGCIFENGEYQRVCAEVNALKIELFGSENVILHSRDIRKCEGVFMRLFDLDIKKRFYAEINRILSSANFTLITVAIKKAEFIAKYGKIADDPYELSLSFLLERAVMETDNSASNTLEIIIEARGDREDKTLQKRYNALLDRGTEHISPARFKSRFAKMAFRRKKENDCGLQIADLCAYPIARHIINPSEPYPPFDIIEPKLRKGPNGRCEGFGLKIFP